MERHKLGFIPFQLEKEQKNRKKSFQKRKNEKKQEKMIEKRRKEIESETGWILPLILLPIGKENTKKKEKKTKKRKTNQIHRKIEIEAFQILY